LVSRHSIATPGDDLREAVALDDVQVQARLDGGAHLARARLAAGQRELQSGRRRVDALPGEAVGQRQQVGGRAADDFRLEVGDQLHLLLGLPS